MGSSLSQSSRSLNKDTSNSNSISNSNFKENHKEKFKYANPENRVLPVVTHGPQRLRSTDNGNILQSGGTISKRKTQHVAESAKNSELTRFHQKKYQACDSVLENPSFQTLFGHKKSHSDPDIVRKMMEENENETDEEDERYETESNPNQRSVIALSPSKAKIKSRKKKKAPEPPQPNTLPRAVVRRNSSKRENQEINEFNSTSDVSTPRRPLPPIPFDEMPPPPPPPSPDYNYEREVSKAPRKNFQKNRRIVDKWKFIKPNSEYFAERRQRSKSLDRADDHKLKEKEQGSNGEYMCRNYSFRRVVPQERPNSFRKEETNGFQREEANNFRNRATRKDSTNFRRTASREETNSFRRMTSQEETNGFRKMTPQEKTNSFRRVTPQEETNSFQRMPPREETQLHQTEETIPAKLALNQAIIEAAKKREERVARNRTHRNLSFRSSMNQTCEANDTGQPVVCGLDPSSRERGSYNNGNMQSCRQDYRNSHNRENEIYAKSNKAYRSEPHVTCQQSSFQGELSARVLKKSQEIIQRERNVAEQRISSSNEIPEKFLNGQRNSNEDYVPNDKSYNKAYLNRQLNKERAHSCVNRDQCKRAGFNANAVQYPNEYKESFGQTGHTECKTYSIEREEHYLSDNKNSSGESNPCHLSRNFSRVGAMHKRSYEKKKKQPPSYRAQDEEKVPNQITRELGILPSFPTNKQIKRNSKSQEPIIPFLPNGTVSSSSISEEEMEINLQLRPTLPRKPIEIPRFSPTDVWKSINLDFFKSHQQRSDVSSEDGEIIMEEKIHRINRPVAPRRLIHDRSGDSGISPDAGSPMFLNENFDSPIIASSPLCSPNVPSNEETNATWVPQQDLDESECGSEDSREKNPNVTNTILQPKLAMPNLMFPSRSLPRTDQKSEIEEKDTATKDKSTSRDRRKRRGSKSNEMQHFNSLRNLKRVLGLKPKPLVADVNDIDSNWLLSRSLPSFQNVENLVDAKPVKEVPQEIILDQKRSRSNSESKIVKREDGRIYSPSKNINHEWRKSFPGQCSEGHIMYLPEYYTTNIPGHIHLRKADEDQEQGSNTNNLNFPKDETGVDKENCMSKTKPKSKKKFSYQSTMRQLEKKKIEAQLAKEIKEKEKQRESEKQLINFVEDEFRKHRVKDKLDVRQRLRIHSLEVNTSCQDTLNGANGTTDDLNTFKGDLNSASSGHNLKNTQSSSFTQGMSQGISKTKTSVENSRTPKELSMVSNTTPNSTQIYDQPTEDFSQETDSSLHFKHASKQFVPSNEEQNKVLLNSFPNTYITQKASCDGRTLLTGKESSMNKNDCAGKTAKNSLANTYAVEGTRGIDRVLVSGKSIPTQQSYHPSINNAQKVDYKVTYQNSSAQTLNDFNGTKKVTFSQSTRDGKIHPIHGKTEPDGSAKARRSYFEVIDAREKDTSYNGQQPTGMKKWLIRQNRDHQCTDNFLRPEPEGGRSSSDDCKQVEGKRERPNGRSHVNSKFQGNARCNHRNGSCHGNCQDYRMQLNGLPKEFTETDDERRMRAERESDGESEVHPKMPTTNENGPLATNSPVPVGTPIMGESVEEYELHTRLCRTSSGRTFESHSYYALERRKEDSTEYESTRKRSSVDVSTNNLFSSVNFENELRENVRKKTRDFDKKIRKHTSCVYDSDDSLSDQKEDRYQRHNVRNPKKRPLSDRREPSFSRNHPHRNGARIKPQTNGHFQNGRTCNIQKSSQTLVT